MLLSSYETASAGWWSGLGYNCLGNIRRRPARFGNPTQSQPATGSRHGALLVGKLFLVDLARLEAIWRILFFLGFGGLFLVLSYYFQARWKRSGKFADEFGDGESGRQQEPEEG